MADEDFDSSPGTQPGIRPPSGAALRYANIAALLNSIATEYQKAAGIVDGLPSDERRIYERRIAHFARETARAVKALGKETDPG